MDEFGSPHRRLKQAIQKSHRFYTGLTDFLRSDFHSVVVEFDPRTGCDLHKCKLQKFPPDELTDLVYEAIEALRSALDHTAYACALLSGVTGKKLERVAFPISRDPEQFESSIASACQEIHPEIVNLFREFSAYPGGNEVLVQLNLIRRQAHHRVIVPVGTAGEVHPGLGSITATRPEYIPAPIWDGEKHEMVFRADCPSGSFGYNAQVSFDLVFGKVDGVSGRPVWPFLISAAEAVDKVVRDTEVEARRLWGS